MTPAHVAAVKPHPSEAPERADPVADLVNGLLGQIEDAARLVLEHGGAPGEAALRSRLEKLLPRSPLPAGFPAGESAGASKTGAIALHDNPVENELAHAALLTACSRLRGFKLHVGEHAALDRLAAVMGASLEAAKRERGKS
jgi:hypothetical protein